MKRWYKFLVIKFFLETTHAIGFVYVRPSLALKKTTFSSFNGKLLKLVDHFIYLCSNILSTESDMPTYA